MHNFKSLLILDSEYNLEKINDKWYVKNILIKDLIFESIVAKLKYVKCISNNTNIKLFYDKKIIKNLPLMNILI